MTADVGDGTVSTVVFSFVAGSMLWLDGGTPPTAALRVSLLCPLGHLCSGMPRTGVSLLGDPTSQRCTTASFKSVQLSVEAGLERAG